MSDIVERAYIAVSEDYCQGTEWCWSGVGEPLRRFADIVVLSETETLRAENAKLRDALKPFADIAKELDADSLRYCDIDITVAVADLRAARAAIEGEKG